MAFVFVAPEALAAAVADLHGIGSALEAARATVASPTTAVVAAGSDEVSAAIAALFNQHGQGYQVISAGVKTFHDQFAQTLGAGAASYGNTEAANATPMQAMLNALKRPLRRCWGAPWSAMARLGPGAPQRGEAGLLYGNGGNGFNSSTAGGAGGNGGGGAGLFGNGGDGGTRGARRGRRGRRYVD